MTSCTVYATLEEVILDIQPREVRAYQRSDGRTPFREWLNHLDDLQARNVIRTRIRRLELGLLGDCRPVGGGVLEARVHFGPGYRLYFGMSGLTLILLLWGGDKSSQERDIERAKRLWQEFRGRL